MSEYYISHSGAELDEAISKVKNGYILPSGDLEITSNGTFDVTEFAKAIVNVASGITPIDNLTEELIVRSTGSFGPDNVTIPKGYYVNEDITITEWTCGQLTGSGTTGGSYVVPYSAIGFVPRCAVLVANSDSLITANTVLAMFGSNGVGRSYYTGSKSSLSTTYTINSGSHYPTINANGITFPAISGVNYGKYNYRWFALR